MLEKLLDVDKMLAEFMPYRGGWKREEVSNHGNFKPAMTRLAKGDGRTRQRCEVLCESFAKAL